MADRYDVIVIGAGHNGLTTAAMLAKKGHRVLVLERRDVTGGLCAGEEFHPGYRSPGILHDTSCVRRDVVDTLRLREYGLEFEAQAPPVLFAEQSGKGLLLFDEPEKAAKEISRHSERDAVRYREFRRFVEKARGLIAPLLSAAPVDIGELTAGGMLSLAKHGLALRSLGSRDMIEMLRVPPMCVADWLREYFETELLCAGLAQPAILGTWCGPWSPGTAANLVLREVMASGAVRGGGAALAAALDSAARSLGVEVRTGAEVDHINVTKGAATGVTLAGGEQIDARAVAASCDPRTTFLSLLRAADVPHALDHGVSVYRMRGTTAKVHLALNAAPAFASRPDTSVEYARTGERLDDQERAFDAVKYREFSKRPLLDIYIPSVSRPEYAPDGHASVSVLVHFAPYELEEGWSDATRERLGDTVVAELESYAPGISGSIVAREVLSPADIGSRYGVTGGHVHHGEHGLDQLITRPTMETARYTTPLGGLYLCGGGSHPGGGITCAPGSIAARSITLL